MRIDSDNHNNTEWSTNASHNAGRYTINEQPLDGSRGLKKFLFYDGLFRRRVLLVYTKPLWWNTLEWNLARLDAKRYDEDKMFRKKSWIKYNESWKYLSREKRR